MPQRKEIRWFTRGEFTTAHLSPGDRHLDQSQRGDRELSDQSSIFSFTNSFVTATREIFAHPDKLITVDGGPHTLWWLVNTFPIHTTFVYCSRVFFSKCDLPLSRASELADMKAMNLGYILFGIPAYQQFLEPLDIY